MRQIRPVPSSMKLAPTLAQRVFQLREFRNLTVKDVARSARFSVQRIEDIEAGIETWLSVTERQLLAKALNVEPGVLQEVESRFDAGQHAPDGHMLNSRTTAQISQAILEGGRDLPCPDCGAKLVCDVTEGIDMEGHPIFLPKAFCSKCPFVLR